ncbi:MAG: FkbM family methyltransferase [Chthoniobacterales bacterium]
MALHNTDGKGNLHSFDIGNPGMSTLTPWSETHYDEVRSVTLARADTLIQNGTLPAPNVIKIDVEGSEALVLAGFGDYLANPALEAIVIEARADLHQNPTTDAVGTLLTDAGFLLRPLTRNEQSAHSLMNFLAERPKSNLD